MERPSLGGGIKGVSSTFFDELCLLMIVFDSLENGQNLLVLRDKMLFRVDLKGNPPSESAG